MVDTTFTLFGLSILISAHVKNLALAALIGFVMGFERQLRKKKASIRTFATICVGSCLFTILSVEAMGGPLASKHDISRIAAQIVSGIGFLGGGVIFRTIDKIEGVTTGALVWLTAAIGMACGFNQTYLVFWTMVIVIIVHEAAFLLYMIMDNFRGPTSRGEMRNEMQ